MPARRSTELGLLCLAGAFVLALVRFALPYLWDAVMAATPAGGPSLSLHTVWIPISGLVVDGGIAVLGLIGFTLLWRGRWELGPENAAWSGLTQLALLVAVVAYAAYTLAGVFLGFVPGAAFLAPWRSLLLFVGALFVGAALYWTLSHLPATGVAPAAAVAFALGVAGSALLLVGTPGLRRGEALGVHGAGLGLSLASSILWLVLCVWGSQRLRERTAPSPSPGTVHGG